MDQTYVALLNGKIITVDENDTIAEAVLLADDRIIAVGTNKEIRGVLPHNGTTIDLGGRAVIPGIVDSHVHTELTVNSLTNAVNVHTPPYTSVEQILNVIKQRVDQAQKGEWIIARGSNALPEKLMEGRLPTRQELDNVAPDNPVIFNMEVHVNILNTLAIETMGWTQESRLPNGATLGRDPQTGDLTGVFTEGWEQLPLMPWGYEKLLEALRVGTVEHFVSNGVTSIHELPYSTDGIRAWQQLKREENLPLRLRLYLQHPNLVNIDQFLKGGLQAGFGDEWLSIGGIKLFVDGQGIHANLHPVFDNKYSQEELNELVYKVHSSGLHLWTHVATEPAFEMGLKAYEQALKRFPSQDHRLRLEHAAEQLNQYSDSEEKIRRMKSLGIIPIMTPQFTHCLPDFVSPTLRNYIDKGLILPGNSDSTGSQPEGCSPWHGIWVAVTQENYYQKKKYPNQGISPLEAIRMFTLWGAWGGFEEKIKGSIEPGKLADMVVLGEDPLTCEHDALREMPVELVMIGGEIKSAKTGF